MVICNRIRPLLHFVPFYNLFLPVFKSHQRPTSFTQPLTFGRFVAPLCLLSERRPVLSQLGASTLLCLSQLLIRSHLCLPVTVKDETRGLNVKRTEGRRGRIVGLQWGYPLPRYLMANRHSLLSIHVLNTRICCQNQNNGIHWRLRWVTI